MVDYAKLPTNWRASEPEEADEEGEALTPAVTVVINDHRENGKSQTFAVSVSIFLPRMKEE